MADTETLLLCWECVCHMEATHDITWAGGKRGKVRCEHCGHVSICWRYDVRPRQKKRRASGRAAHENVCSGCVYGAEDNDHWICQYAAIREASRPCPLGAYCTVREDDPQRVKQIRAKARAQTQSRPRPPKWDFDKAAEMYRQGRTLDEIAQAVGANRETVRLYMRNRGMTFESKRSKLKWDPERAIELRRQGVSYREIAQAVGASKSLVYKYLCEHDIKPETGGLEKEMQV